MARIQDSETGRPKSTVKKQDSKKKSIPPDTQLLVAEPDYTHYGDWQIKGKCIDF